MTERQRIIQIDEKKISVDVLGVGGVLNFIFYQFSNKPIVLKDKRRNPKYYEVLNFEYEVRDDDFIKGLFSIRRKIVRKTTP